VITLDLQRRTDPRELTEEVARTEISLVDIERRLNGVMRDLSTLVDEVRRTTILFPSDVLFQAYTALFPVERMGILSARSIVGRTIVGPMYDVTGVGHRAHVRAEPSKLGEALLQIDRCGAYMGAWIHSHPGSGALATSPSEIDRRQYADWVQDYGIDLVGIIVAADGFVRFWGDAVESGRVRVEIVGDGVNRLRGERHVYRMD
jgi:Prokaryotic homologs of the JAB domain